ncbi:MAG TPA: PAS domain S-box protein [Pyrinomonadaceae bacterium]|nr:PAS domain S-box protein [Pyrinomonadaceae bacterium]
MSDSRASDVQHVVGTRRFAKPFAARQSRPAVERYGMAFALVVASTALTFVLQNLHAVEAGRIPFVFYFPAVVIATLYGGRGAGIFTSLLSALTSAYFFIPPFYSLAVGFSGVVQLSVFLFVSLLIHSLTERSLSAEQRARASNQWLATTLSSIGDAVIATDTTGSVTFMNPVAEKLTGWPEAEARGRPLREVFPIIHEGTRAEVESPVEKVLREGTVVGLANHTLLVRRDGTEVAIDDSGAPIKDERGTVAGVVLVFHEITERRRAEHALRESEERFRTLAAIIESSEDAIIGKTLDGIVTSWNAGAERLYGYAAEEIIGRSLSLIFPDERRDELAQILDRIKRGENVEPTETVRVAKDGHRVEVSISVSPIKDAQGRIIGASTIARDVGMRNRIEEERARLAAQVERERGRLRQLVSNVPGVVWEAWGEPDDAGQRIDFVSDHVETMLGYSVEEWLATPNFWLTIVHPEDRERAAQEAHAIFESGTVGTSRFRWLRKDGRTLYVEAQSMVILDEAGRPVGMRGVTMDITERRLAEEALRASEERYRYLADSMPQIVWTARPDGYFDYYNRRWFEYTGLAHEQARGWGWQPAIHPQDLERVVRGWAGAVESKRNFTVEYRLRRASDGAYRWHLGRAEPMHDAEGNVVKWFGTATDIHDRKQAEETLRFLAEASALLASSLDYEIILERLAGLSVPTLADYCLIDVIEDDERVRRVATVHADPSKREAVRALREYPPDPAKAEGIASVLRTGEPLIVADVTPEQLRAITRDETHAALLAGLGLTSFVTVPLLARQRTLGALTLASTGTRRQYTLADLSFAEELARRAALAIENARLYKRAQEANKAKDEFLATLSHELRTPLTPIIGWVHMMRSGRLRETDAAQGLIVIDKNSQALTRLINDLLDMSSIMSGKMRIERAPVVLTEVLREAVETIRPQADQLGVRVETSFDGCDASATISGDHTRLAQVFWNLLNNAIKFSGEGGVVRVECVPVGEAEVRIDVSDEGEGIPEEFLPYVFDRFRQADQSTTRARGGLGIGLALVKSFVEAHGGRTSVTSGGTGRGSRFSVTLPLMRRAAVESLTGETEVTAKPLCPGGVCRVLLVEDAPDTLDMLKVVFDARGYETTACETADEALHAASSLWFDIVVSDIGLPLTDGYELIRRLREIPHLRDVPAVALTGYAAQKDAETALAAGFNVHIPKPVDPDVLSDAVEQLLQEHQRPAEESDE